MKNAGHTTLKYNKIQSSKLLTFKIQMYYSLN